MCDAALINPNHVLVAGWENGGVELCCLLCNEIFAGGGCDCCEENEVTLADLLQASQDHICKEPPNV